jgi:hypothetical protein
MTQLIALLYNENSIVSVRKANYMPTEQPPLGDEVITNFSG